MLEVFQYFVDWNPIFCQDRSDFLQKNMHMLHEYLIQYTRIIINHQLIPESQQEALKRERK